MREALRVVKELVLKRPSLKACKKNPLKVRLGVQDTLLPLSKPKRPGLAPKRTHAAPKANRRIDHRKGLALALGVWVLFGRHRDGLDGAVPCAVAAARAGIESDPGDKARGHDGARIAVLSYAQDGVAATRTA